MKTLRFSLPHWLAVAGYAAAQNAYLYNIDIQPRLPSPSIFSPIDSTTANDILARRLGAAESVTIGSIDDITLEHLDQYGGQRAFSLFGDSDTMSKPDRLVVAMEGYDGQPLPASPGLAVRGAEISLAENSLMEHLVLRSSYGVAKCDGYVPLSFGVHATYIMAAKKEKLCMKREKIIGMLGDDKDTPAKGDGKAIQDALNANVGKESRIYMKLRFAQTELLSKDARNAAIKQTFDNFYEALQRLAEQGGVESTILLLPSQRSPQNLHLGRRQDTPRQEGEEALLSPPSDTNSPAPASNTTISHPLPPLGSFLPSCFPSNETCTSSTNVCSGHGFCYAASSRCFACRCGSTIVRQDSDGKNVKTVQWGGTACEKKDISVPFFLFAGFGILMSALIAGGIGLLWGMGSEELPSVIGAGVTGPRAQR